jgi:hypothetical protein
MDRSEAADQGPTRRRELSLLVTDPDHTSEDGEETGLWCARDALVLKALAL